MDFQLISRADARAKGLTRYFTGKPCKYGHITERTISSNVCLQCGRQRTAQWIADNPEQKRNNDRKSYLKHFNRAKETYTKWYSKNSARQKSNMKSWYIKHKEQHLERFKIWCAKNHEKKRVIDRNRRARQSGSEGTHTVTEVMILLEKQKWICAGPMCQTSLRKARHLDHIMPLIKGGSNNIANLQWLCPTCNLRKYTKDPIDFAQENGLLL